MNKPTRKSAQMTTIGFAVLLGLGGALARPAAEDPARPLSVLVLLGEWFGDAYFPLTKEIKDRGWTMKRVGVDVEYRGCYNKERDVVLRSDILIPDLKDFAGYDALIIPSGPQWRKFNENPTVLEFVRNAHAAGLIVASFCVGNTTVKAAGLVDLPAGPELYPDKVTLVQERVLIGPRGGGHPPGDGFESAPIKEICDAVAREQAGKGSHRSLLTGPYLGQKPPGLTPEVFAPGIVSSADFIDFKGAFSPDGQEYYFYRHALPEVLPVLLFTRIENGAWTKPAPLPIAQGARTSHPCVSLDNQWLFFYWQFPSEQNRPTGFYASPRSDAGWSAPHYAGPGMYLTCDNTGRFYTTESVWGDQPKHYLASMTFSQGRFSRPERLTIQPHYENQTHPCIAPDGSYIIFDINVENGSLFVSFKDNDGNWGEAIDLTKHGFKPDSRGAYISPDGQYLFFSVDGDIWWVSSKVIEALRPK
jgi:hypothetical protein